MLKNAYGTNQEHLEPDVIADIPIPVPKSRELIESIGDVVIRSIEDLEQSIEASNSAKNLLNTLMEQSGLASQIFLCLNGVTRINWWHLFCNCNTSEQRSKFGTQK